ncbi:hypothetical protein [Salinibacter ruber]|uniref:hypothetical protein n=1 Tax=Salinibacter ruber TaxID=146919 RepID=UPI0021683E49|nr:hypothetical protein [Salinibacter ruber]
MDGTNRRERIGRLFDQLAEAVLHDKEEAREVLEDAGKSPEEVRRRGREFIGRVSGQAKLAEAKQKKSRLERLRDEVKDYLDHEVENAKEALAEAMAGISGETPEFHFRKIEDLSEEDALEMLDEVELLRVLEERDQESGEQDK